MRHHLTLSLTVWGVAIILGPLAVIYAVLYTQSVNPSGSIFWLVVLVGFPVLIVSILTGLAAGLGAHIGRRMVDSKSEVAAVRNLKLPTIIGAGVGAMTVGTLPLGYGISLVQGAPPVSLMMLICATLLFALFAGFTALRVKGPRS